MKKNHLELIEERKLLFQLILMIKVYWKKQFVGLSKNNQKLNKKLGQIQMETAQFESP